MKTYKLYNLLCCMMVTILLACDVLAFKTITIFDIHFAVSGLLFPFSFLIVCIMTEVYGYALAGRVVWIQLACSLSFISLINLLVLPEHQFSVGLNHAYYQLYGSFWKVMISSVSIPTAYFVTEWVMSRFKLNNFWFSLFRRYILANLIGKFIIVAIAYPINFCGIYETSTIIKLIFNTWIFKVCAAIVLAPAAGFLTAKIKKIEKLDTFDYGISYNPLLVFNDQKQGKNQYHE